MTERIKNIILSAAFFAVLLSLMLAAILRPDKAVSASERRKLAQFPAVSTEAILSGRFMTDLESWSLDQFPLREQFRQLKAITRLYGFRQADNNGLFVKDGVIYKLEYPQKDASIEKAAKKMNAVAENYLKTDRVFYAVIPDKTSLIAEKHGIPSLRYTAVEDVLGKTVENMTAIPIGGCLTIDDYYRTDTHWRQERLGAVYDRLAESMGLQLRFADTMYRENRFSPFYGVYYGQAALPLQGEEIVYLTSDGIDNAAVFNYETQAEESVYMLDKTAGMDPYDLFLSGASALLTIDNPNAASDRELILFRDSFGSSIAPLFIAEYQRIYVVDLRYLSSAYLDRFIPFSENQDVLFLFSTLVLNNGDVLK